MIKASVEIKNNSSVLLKNIKETELLVEEATEVMAKRMRDSLTSGAKSGRQYYIDGARHTSSAPGQAPASVTGALVRSIKTVTKKGIGNIFIKKNYAIYLEYGTTKMRPRPFILPAFLYTKQWIMNKLKNKVIK